MPGGYWSCLCFPLVRQTRENTVWSRWRWRLCKWCFELSSHWKDGQFSVEYLPLLFFPFFFVTLQNSVLLVPSSSKSRGLFTLSIPLPRSLFLPRTSSDSPSLFPCFLVFYVRICIFTKSCYRWQSSSSFSSKRCITTYTRADCEREEAREREEEEGARKGRWEVLEHCSADKLMQQSRLTQQRTPNLAQCLREQPGHTGSPAKQKNHYNKGISS